MFQRPDAPRHWALVTRLVLYVFTPISFKAEGVLVETCKRWGLRPETRLQRVRTGCLGSQPLNWASSCQAVPCRAVLHCAVLGSAGNVRLVQAAVLSSPGSYCITD